LLSKESEHVNQPIVSESTRLATPISADNLIQYWDDYAEKPENKAHLKSIMINCKPIIVDDNSFEVKVNNPAQQEELMNSSIELLKIIRTQLQNDHIQMHIRIDEISEKKRAYTAIEKFEFLNEINPALSKLKEEFDLEID
jgi:DNA polymerase-3 subunit gamma/tau